jgi:hypothetical protein
MKIHKIVAIVLISSIFFGCATIAPRAVEDSDDGPVLVVEVNKILKVVENWGFQNGFQYVAYRRIGTVTSTEGGIYGNQYGVYGSSKTVYYSKVLVFGINNIEDVPENYNVTTVPSERHTEMTEAGAYLLGTGIGIGLGLLILIPIMNM